MPQNRRPRLMVANWKMHKTAAETRAFFQRLCESGVPTDRCFIVVAPSFPSLPAAAEAAKNCQPAVAIAGQNLHWEREGAFTGEVSGPMLAAAGCSYVLVGHSERRQYFGETDETVHKKVQAALGCGLTPIVCVGETSEQRQTGEIELILRIQFERAFWGMSAEELGRSVLAYEPVWAIGTGNTASPEVAEAAHCFLRRCALEIFGPEAAAGLPILYGGSIHPASAKALFQQPDVDGGLVGGASLDPGAFAALLRAL
jgi:triosephosphate isomerase (TIM)